VPDYDESHPALEKVKWKFEEFTLRNDWRKELGGDSYDGTSQTLDSDSLQGELLAQIEHGVSDHFNNQKIFERVIQASSVAAEKSNQASEKS
jgi:hypothetical protein